MGQQQVKWLLCPAREAPYVRSSLATAARRVRGRTAPFNVTGTGIPYRDLAAPGVASGEQRGGSPPAAKAPLCSASAVLA